MSEQTHKATEVNVQRNDGWAVVMLNRPERKNAMTGPMMDQLADAIDELSADGSIAAVILRGADGAFSSGVDLTELQRDPPHPWVDTFSDSLRRAHIALYNCACPVIVALERYGINGSTALALAGDLVVAGESTFLQIGEIQQGARIPMNAAWASLKLGQSALARMALIGDRVPADELLRLGAVHEIVGDDAVVQRAEALAQRLAGFPDGSARTIKADIKARFEVESEAWFVGPSSPALRSAAQVRE